MCCINKIKIHLIRGHNLFIWFFFFPRDYVLDFLDLILAKGKKQPLSTELQSNTYKHIIVEIASPVCRSGHYIHKDK